LKSPRQRLILREGRRRIGAAPSRNATLTLTPNSDAGPKARKISVDGRPADLLAQTILTGLEDAKAEEIVAIDLGGKTTLADTMIIATGRSSTHVSAIADRVIKACREAGFPPPRAEGLPLGDWVLLDARDAIVHIFRPDVRQFYNLEKMWSADRPGETRKS
jgi:ribosome-associated protein